MAPPGASQCRPCVLLRRGRRRNPAGTAPLSVGGTAARGRTVLPRGKLS